MLCLESKLLGAAASPSPTAPSLAQLVRHAQNLGQSDQPRGVKSGCRASSYGRNLGHWRGSSSGASAGTDAGNLSTSAAAARPPPRPPPSLSSLGRVLILHTDSRAPLSAPGAYWSITAAANALYAHMHGMNRVELGP